MLLKLLYLIYQICYVAGIENQVHEETGKKVIIYMLLFFLVSKCITNLTSFGRGGNIFMNFNSLI